MNRTIPAQDLKKLLDAGKDIILLDVRRKADIEADGSSIAAATWRDPEQVETWSADLPKDRDVVIYCARGGSVSNTVLDKLLAKNIQAQYLEGGIAAWKTAGNTTK
jgi:rhodanese-related sulfurtransferase